MTYTLEWRPAQEQTALVEEPFDVWRSFDGDVSTMFHRTPTGFFVRFADCGDYTIDLAEKRVICTPVPDVPDDYCENIFSNQILPLLWTYDGTPVLHASGVVIDGGAFGFQIRVADIDLQAISCEISLQIRSRLIGTMPCNDFSVELVSILL